MLQRLRSWANNDRLIGWFILVLAAVPRLVPHSGVYLNVDAAGHWVVRTKTFLLGLTSGNLFQLAPTGHPGVPLMWLTSISELALHRLHLYRWFHDPIVGYLTVLKAPLLLATAILAGLIWWIGRRVLPRGFAFTLAIIFALDPLYLVYSRYLQLDALLTGCVFLGLVVWWGALRQTNITWAFWAGVCFALATLTRLNACVAFVYVVITWAMLTDRKEWRMWRNLFIGAGLTVAILWPVSFVHPLFTLATFSWGVNLGFTTHELISLTGIPEWIRMLYFPIFLLTRISTLELMLLVSGIGLLIRNRRDTAARPVWYFVGWTGLTLIELAIARKQIDRYALPAVIGILAICAFTIGRMIRWPRRKIWLGALAVGIIWQVIAIGRLQPFFQTYRNALGEGLVRTQVTESSALWPDWGEGVREAGNELRARTGRWPTMASWFPAILCVYGHDFSEQTFPYDDKANLQCGEKQYFFSPQARDAEYILISRDQVHQKYYPVEQIAQLGWKPEFVIRLNGQPYVWVYRNQGNLPKFQE